MKKSYNKIKSKDNSNKITVKVPKADLEGKISPPSLSFYGSTDIGRERKHNEDDYLMYDLNQDQILEANILWALSTVEKGLLILVADGMGGAAAGDLASRMVKDTIKEWFEKNWHKKNKPAGELPTIIQGGIREANRRILSLARKKSKYQGMGSTITAATVQDNYINIAQVGDSRCYLVREKQIVQVTQDQSLVGKLVEAGNLTKEEARNHIAKNVILQAIGVSEDLEVGFYSLSLRNDDVLLLCTDGLTDMLSDSVILQIIESEPDARLSVSRLIAEANEAGGRDNITIILGKFSGTEDDTTSNEKKHGSDVETQPIMVQSFEQRKPTDDKTSRYIVPPKKKED